MHEPPAAPIYTGSDPHVAEWADTARRLLCDTVLQHCEHSTLPVHLTASTTSGKLLRPMLMLAVSDMCGGDRAAVLPAAAALELGHVGSLIHDDIIDHDDLRRGKPTLHRVVGTEQAIVMADSLFFSAFTWGDDAANQGAPAAAIARAFSVMSNDFTDMCRGELLQNELCRSGRDTLEDYRRMVALKTGALFACAASCGAILSGADDPTITRFRALGSHIGQMLQYLDDLLIFSPEDTPDGKNKTSDILNGRITLPYLVAVEALDRDISTELRAQRALAASGVPVDVEAIYALIDNTTVRSRAIDVVTRMASTCYEILEHAPRADGWFFTRCLVSTLMESALAHAQ